ncbi:MAG: hypothetical protein Q9160_008155 [Pyrenula sp. 1 TL-2023]
MFHLPARPLSPETRRYRREGLIFPSAPDLGRYAPPPEEPPFDFSPSASSSSLTSEYTASPASISRSSSYFGNSWQLFQSQSDDDAILFIKTQDRVKTVSSCATSSYSVRFSQSNPNLNKADPPHISPAAIHPCAICSKLDADVQVNVTWADGRRSNAKSCPVGANRVPRHERVEQLIDHVQSIKGQSSQRFREEAAVFVCEVCWNMWLARQRAEMRREPNIVKSKEKEQTDHKKDRKPSDEKIKEYRRKACPDERSKAWRRPFRFP